MEFKYNNKTYILSELNEPNKNISYDIIAIFEVMDDFKYKFINYFYGVDEDNKKLIDTSIIYIENYYKK